jgi:hypothetical protein
VTGSHGKEEFTYTLGGIKGMPTVVVGGQRHPLLLTAERLLDGRAPKASARVVDAFFIGLLAAAALGLAAIAWRRGRSVSSWVDWV